MFNYNKYEQEMFVNKYGFKMCNYIKYLGINIVKVTQKLKEQTFNKLKSDIKDKLQEYSKLKLLWFGRIAMIKMKILPKITFLFRMLLIQLEDF